MEKMRELFHKASEADRPVYISAVNWAEVLYKMERKHGKAGLETARQFEHTTPLEAVPVDRELAEVAAHLEKRTRFGTGRRLCRRARQKQKGRTRHRRPRIQIRRKGNQNQLACEISGW